MATVTKDFKVKAGLIVEGANGTINGSDIITEDIITGGTQTNIAVTYNPSTKTLDFVAENGVADSTTDDLQEGSSNLYFTDERAQDAIATAISAGTQNGIAVTYDDNSNSFNFNVNDPTITIDGDVDGSATITNLGNTTITVELDTVNQNVGSFGSTTKIPTFTVNGKGLLTAAGEVDVATNLSIAGDTGTDTLSLLTDTATFSGGNGITTTVTDNTVTIDIDSSVATLSDAQTLTNKTIGDTLIFNDGANNSSIDVVGNDLSINANNSLTLNTLNGDITLNPDGFAYITSTTESNKIATQGYVDNAVSGLAWKESVHLLASSNVDLTGTSGTLVIDGHSALDQTDTYRLLLIGQTAASENGIYNYSDDGNAYTLTRSADADTVEELHGAAVFVMEGTQYNATSWVQSNHYATTFDQLTWTQFSGTGNYTAGFGINLVGREFSADTSEMATAQSLTDAVSNLTDYVDGFLNSTDGTTIEYIDDQDAATLLAANGYSDALVAAGDATATPQYLAINVNDVAKQVAATSAGFATLPTVAYAFAATEYRSAEFLVKLAYSTHTELSKVALTLDTSDNIAITEYAVVGTNGSLSTITATVAGGVVQLQVTPANDSTITVVGTLLV